MYLSQLETTLALSIGLLNSLALINLFMRLRRVTRTTASLTSRAEALRLDLSRLEVRLYQTGQGAGRVVWTAHQWPHHTLPESVHTALRPENDRA